MSKLLQPPFDFSAHTPVWLKFEKLMMDLAEICCWFMSRPFEKG